MTAAAAWVGRGKRSTPPRQKGGMTVEYSSDMPQRLRDFFINGQQGEGLPSLPKFALSAGVTMAEVGEWIREQPEFEQAVYQAQALTVDYLIDCGLKKIYDPAFVKYLLSDISVLFPAARGKDSISVSITVTG